MERWEAKIIALLLIFALPLVFTLLPYKLSGYFCKKGEKGKKILSCLMCFGGGVFFATYMLHLGPEVRGMLHMSLMVPYNIHYPIPDLSIAVGFFLVLYLEKFAVRYNTNRQKRKRQRIVKCVSAIASDGHIVKEQSKCIAYGEDPIKVTNENHNHYVLNGKEVDGYHAVDIATKFLSDACTNDHGRDQLTVKHELDSSDSEDAIDVHGTRSLILMLALSLHRIFDGMGVGLQTKTQNVWNLLIAVVCHEVVIGFSLGLDFVKNNYTWRRLLVTAILCSLIMPVGIVIGIGISELGNETAELQIANGLLQGLTCGTFIYVTFMEILHEEMDAMDTSLAKVTSVLVGFGLMAALSAVPEGGTNMTKILTENSTSTAIATSVGNYVGSTIAY
jgi:zinc transporter 1/2/3